MRKALSVIIFLLVVFGASAQRWQKVGQGSLNFPNGEPSVISIDKLYPLSASKIIAYGYKTLIMSSDGGNSWSDKSPAHSFHIYKVHFFDSVNGIAVGDSIYPDPLDPLNNTNHRGLLLKTDDAGTTWYHLSNRLQGEKDGFLSSDFVDSNTFFVSAYSPVYKTTDGGKTYTEIIRVNNATYNALNFINDSIGMIRSYAGSYVFYSENGFKTNRDSLFRDPFDNNNLILLNKMYFDPTKKTGFIITGNGGIIRTVNAGKTWQGFRFGQEDGESDFGFSDSMNGWKVSSGNKVYRYIDHGNFTNSWVLDTVGLNDTSIKIQASSRVAMVNPDLGYLVNKYNDNIYNIFRYSSSTAGNNIVKGKIYIDQNANYSFDSLQDIPLQNIVVLAQPGNYFSSSKADGSYEFNLPIGNYTLELLLPTGMEKRVQLLSPVSGRFNVSVLSTPSTVQNNFLLKGVNNSPQLLTTITSNRRRRCFQSVTVVNYGNMGFSNSQNTVVKVKLPQYTELDSASVSYTIDAEGNYLFNIGTVPPFGGGSITLYDRVVCGIESIRGLTVCTEAYITGDGVNYKTDTTAWDSSEVIVNAKCLNTWVIFEVINQTDKDMTDSLPLRIYSNATLVSNRNYKLLAKDTLKMSVRADFTTFRLEADQHKGHPLSRYAVATIETCEGKGSGSVSKGFVNKLPVNDFRMRKYVDCQGIIDSYDPNDKAVTPLGITSSNYVKTGTELYYKIRFQNTGTDTAYRVIVRDTLSPNLDLRTFSLGSASHKYTYVIKGQGKPVLEVTFANINLPDSATDEPGSNGFFTYKVGHKQGISQGTTITNKADIYFDFNSPITTNTTTSIIKDTVFSNPIQINPVKGLPFIVRSYTQDSVCEGDTFTLALIGNGPYKWYAANAPSTVLSTSFELKLTAQQTTTIIGETKDGQSAQTVLVKNCKGGSIGVEETQSGSLVVYPNPSKGAFTIYSVSPLTAMEVFTIEGKKVADINNGETEIDLSTERSGIYILIVYNVAGQRSYVKLIKD